jgi:hypothetical protein
VLDSRTRPFLFKHGIFLLKHQMTFIKLEHLNPLAQPPEIWYLLRTLLVYHGSIMH